MKNLSLFINESITNDFNKLVKNFVDSCNDMVSRKIAGTHIAFRNSVVNKDIADEDEGGILSVLYNVDNKEFDYDFEGIDSASDGGSFKNPKEFILKFVNKDIEDDDWSEEGFDDPNEFGNTHPCDLIDFAKGK